MGITSSAGPAVLRCHNCGTDTELPTLGDARDGTEGELEVLRYLAHAVARRAERAAAALHRVRVACARDVVHDDAGRAVVPLDVLHQALRGDR